MNDPLYTIRESVDILSGLTGFDPKKCLEFLSNNRRPERRDESLIPFERDGRNIYYRRNALDVAAARLRQRMLRRKARSIIGEHLPAYVPISTGRALVEDLIGGTPDTWASLLQTADEPTPECSIRIKRRRRAQPLVNVADLHRFAGRLQTIKDSQPGAAADLLQLNQGAASA
ncbi:MAG: hypothetical protein KDH17_09690 [Rhodocyclaceae bacterium]|nr:hypothetical protein [Rhodocyclaceae bacterium]MCP5234804.1 hypothetical protein [Zoogloeaceae bacterium]